MDDLMTKIQEAGEARQERDKAIDEAEELQAQIERLTKERDEAIAKAEDLQEIVDTDAREFEGECWGGLSQLLDECGYQWTPGDSVTVTNAVDHIRETLQDKDRWAEKAEKERDQLAQALTEANRAVEKIAQERDEARARASLDCDATTDGAHEPVSQGKYQFCRQCGETINAPTMTERARKAEARAEKAEKERDEARASAFKKAEKFLIDQAAEKGGTKTPQGRTAQYYARKIADMEKTQAPANG